MNFDIARLEFSPWRPLAQLRNAVRVTLARLKEEFGPLTRMGGLYLFAVQNERPPNTFWRPHLQVDVVYIGVTNSFARRLRTSHHALQKARMQKILKMPIWARVSAFRLEHRDDGAIAVARAIEHELLKDRLGTFGYLPEFNDCL